jgi:hypothetical protein
VSAAVLRILLFQYKEWIITRAFSKLLGLIAELNYELWVGDPAQIRAKQVRKQKNDRRDAEHLLKLMLVGARSPFPS